MAVASSFGTEISGINHLLIQRLPSQPNQSISIAMKKLNLKNAVKFALGKEEANASKGGVSKKTGVYNQVTYRNMPSTDPKKNKRREGSIVNCDSQS
ncbi:MAG: hypothetical protein J0L94_00480 [Rhodothermia bacterium]|nr:hypothetical protein [Rhodothermia bacterium]